MIFDVLWLMIFEGLKVASSWLPNYAPINFYPDLIVNLAIVFDKIKLILELPIIRSFAGFMFNIIIPIFVAIWFYNLFLIGLSVIPYFQNMKSLRIPLKIRL